MHGSLERAPRLLLELLVRSDEHLGDGVLLSLQHLHLLEEARLLVGVDAMSGGRAILALGTGDRASLPEHERYGIPFPVFARASFGVLGANVPALLPSVCAWFCTVVPSARPMAVSMPACQPVPHRAVGALTVGDGKRDRFYAGQNFRILSFEVILAQDNQTQAAVPCDFGIRFHIAKLDEIYRVFF